MRGLPFNNPPQYIKSFGDSHVIWDYNWGSDMPPDFPDYLKLVPMLWGDRQGDLGNWFINANNAISRGSTHLLAFNETDMDSQAHITPARAADLYRQYMMPFRGKAALGAPAVSSSQDPGKGLEWLRNFFDLCHDCWFDFVPIHIYSNVDQKQFHYDQILRAKNMIGNVKLWITEWSARGTTGQQKWFMDRLIPDIEQDDQIEGYAWFWTYPAAGDYGTLTNWDGSMTELGGHYAWRGSEHTPG
ncbi:hypothetical protein B0J14DRAFT_674143 [Halenospora varia]|nr:hypothetical protein B0J14DRAFT_674143 [Halenospora varia]